MLEEAIAAHDALGRASDSREAIAAPDRVLRDAGRSREADDLINAALAALPDDATDRGAAVLILRVAHNQVVNGQMDNTTAGLIVAGARPRRGPRGPAHARPGVGHYGVRHLNLDNSVTARVLLSAAVDLARSLDDLDLLSVALGNYGQVLIGDDEGADEVLDETMAMPPARAQRDDRPRRRQSGAGIAEKWRVGSSGRVAQAAHDLVGDTDADGCD